MRQYPRLLLISNECISNITSNGRTIRNFLVGWPKDKLAQFCIHNREPDFTVCDRYYCVSDRKALHAFLNGKRASGEMVEATKGAAKGSSNGARNPMTMMIRELIWSSMRWAGKPFYHWVEEFSPQLILLQAGDCAFMMNLARKLAAKYQVPLIIYNSEAYYFKNYDYFRSDGIRKVFYPVYHKLFCRAFTKCISAAKKSIYCCDKLKADYDAVFGLPSEVIYTITQIESAERHHNMQLKIAYMGNLGVGRHEGLVAIGQALQFISSDLKLQVYGKIPNEQVQEAFDSCPGIEYRGFISYDAVVENLHSSDIVVHTESFADFYKEDLKYAFSTKIADSLASGSCFVLYAPENMACTDYLRDNAAAWVISRQEDLQPVLARLCNDPAARAIYLDKAALLVKENHSPDKNTERFQKILFESVGDT